MTRSASSALLATAAPKQRNPLPVTKKTPAPRYRVPSPATLRQIRAGLAEQDRLDMFRFPPSGGGELWVMPALPENYKELNKTDLFNALYVQMLSAQRYRQGITQPSGTYCLVTNAEKDAIDRARIRATVRCAELDKILANDIAAVGSHKTQRITDLNKNKQKYDAEIGDIYRASKHDRDARDRNQVHVRNAWNAARRCKPSLKNYALYTCLVFGAPLILPWLAAIAVLSPLAPFTLLAVTALVWRKPITFGIHAIRAGIHKAIGLPTSNRVKHADGQIRFLTSEMRSCDKQLNRVDATAKKEIHSLKSTYQKNVNTELVSLRKQTANVGHTVTTGGKNFDVPTVVGSLENKIDAADASVARALKGNESVIDGLLKYANISSSPNGHPDTRVEDLQKDDLSILRTSLAVDLALHTKDTLGALIGGSYRLPEGHSVHLSNSGGPESGVGLATATKAELFANLVL